MPCQKNHMVKMVRICKIWNPVVVKQQYYSNISKVTLVPGIYSTCMFATVIYKNKVNIIRCPVNILVKYLIKQIQKIKSLDFNVKIYALNNEGYEIYKQNKDEKDFSKIIQYFIKFLVIIVLVNLI